MTSRIVSFGSTDQLGLDQALDLVRMHVYYTYPSHCLLASPDNRDTTTKLSKTVALHCKFPPVDSNDARYNDRPKWQQVAVEQFAVGGTTRL